MIAKKLTHLAVLDGLRGLAILLVVFSHNTYFVSLNSSVKIPVSFREPLGYYGVLLFFSLSSFLLTTRTLSTYAALFATDSVISISAASAKRITCFWLKFFAMRLLRIYPLLVVYLCFHQIVYQPINIIGCLLLREAPAALWTIRVEIGFYLLIPLIVTSYYHSFNHPQDANGGYMSIFKSMLLRAAWTTTMLWLLRNYEYINSYGYGYTSVFLPGALFGILYHEVKMEDAHAVLKTLTHSLVTRWYGISAGLLMSLNLLLEFDHSRKILAHFLPILGGYRPFVHAGWVAGMMGAVSTWLLVLSPDCDHGNKECNSVKYALSSSVLRFYGKISFSLYIAHLMLYDYVYWFRDWLKLVGSGADGDGDFFSAIDCTVLAFLFSTVCCYVSYRLVEEPSMRYGVKLIKRAEGWALRE